MKETIKKIPKNCKFYTVQEIKGFKKEKYLEHIQYCNNKLVEMYTLVCRRKIKLK